MAEGLVNRFLAAEWQAFSAGTRPSGYVHPLAIKAMAEEGIDISTNESTSVAVYQDETFDLVITVCDQAAEDCPAWLGGGKVIHISFPDPAEARGMEEEKLAVFRSVRDDIRQRIFLYLEDCRT
jgi:arsenate reductase